MRFEFATPPRIVFGPGTLAEAVPAAAQFGQRALLVTRGENPDAERLARLLRGEGVEIVSFPVLEEPSTHRVGEGARLARDARCEVVVAMGGGSVLDAGKGIAALATNPGEPLDYLEVIGKGQKLSAAPLPIIAIPTTAGTGAEVTRNAVLASPEHRVKASLRDVRLTPRLAVIDPELTYDLPPTITASTGMDALTQLIEPFVSNKANPLTDAVCREGMVRVARALRPAYHRGDPAAREDMALASLMGGIALANAKLGAVHGFAGPLGGALDAPHGAVCGRLLPFVMAANVRALHERAPESEALRRYDEVARLLTGNAAATADDGVRWVQALGEELGLPGLAAYGLSEANLPPIVEASAIASSMQGNPIKLTHEEMAAILRQAM